MAANVFRGTLDRLRTRDPSRDGLRRALRAGIAIPLAAMISYLIAGPSLTPVFTLVGSIALLVAADFPGSVSNRATGYAGLGLIGMILITLGTWAAPHPLVAVLLCFAVGAVVSFLGLLSELVAAGQRAALMTFLLPVCMPSTGPLHDRLLGWLLALAVCVPAALFLFPPRYSTELRHLAALVCSALADRIEGVDRSDERVTEAMAALRAEFLSSAFRPMAMTAGSRSLIRVVSNLQWLCDRVDEDTGRLLADIDGLSVAVLRGSAEALQSPSAAQATSLTGVVAAHRLIAFTHYDNDIHDILVEPDDDAAAALGRTLLSRRTMSATIGLTGRLVATATAIDTRPLPDRLLGRGLPETGFADRVHGHRSMWTSLIGYLRTRSITVINSLRTGLALALAVIVTMVLPVQNALWVVLGALSVLRSSASGTRTTAVRALLGTAIGFLIGSAVIAVVGINPVVLWTLLPLATFGTTYVQTVGSFVASQAMFTMQVLIVFNMMRPTGWQIGLVRIEDVILGALVGVAVSILLWPGGARLAVERAREAAIVACSDYLGAAVRRITQGLSPQTEAAVIELGAEALTAARTHGDAVRVYLSETAGTSDTEEMEKASRIPRLRTTADLIADIVPPPAGVFPRTRNLLEERTAVLCAHLERDPDATPPPQEMSDEFIRTLRAEAATTPAAENAALPLVTVAANIGELETVYPVSAVAAESDSAN
ncbi:MAG: FUSC family protein [Mycobacterium sp.]|nr:FUSC family protein [Mycobacterium sp.]